MIEYMKIEQLDAVIDIWYRGNVDAHKDVDPKYWEDNKEFVKEAMAHANIYVAMDGETIQGFVGVSEGYYIAGIFVDADYRGKGIGKKLLDFIKEKYDELTLSVYVTNDKAVRFYKREGFVVEEEALEEDTGLMEYTMVWPETI